MRGRDFRIGSRLCENSEVQFAWRNSVLVSLISEISCTDSLGQEKAIENIFLLVLGSRTFSHSLDPQQNWTDQRGHYRDMFFSRGSSPADAKVSWNRKGHSDSSPNDPTTRGYLVWAQERSVLT